MRDKFCTQVLQRDIEAHGRIVSSVVKLGDKVFTHQQQQQQEQEQQRETKQQSSQPLRTVRLLERRWHLLFLRALEWQCHIETLVSHIRKVTVLLFVFYLSRRNTVLRCKESTRLNGILTNGGIKFSQG